MSIFDFAEKMKSFFRANTNSLETEYGSLGTAPGTFDSNLNAGTLSVRVTQDANTSTNYKITATLIKI